jgi:hypothetical protein
MKSLLKASALVCMFLAAIAGPRVLYKYSTPRNSSLTISPVRRMSSDHSVVYVTVPNEVCLHGMIKMLEK